MGGCSRMYHDDGWFDWAYKGVDASLPGNGGLECRDFLGISQRCLESILATIMAICALSYAYSRLTLPKKCPYIPKEGKGKRILLLLMCLTFGIELGFKFATRRMIWIGNPCHLATMVQIFMLAAPPSRIVTAAFRLQLYMLSGAPLAVMFPVINTRLLPFEVAVYYIQHVLMLIIPFYAMSLGDPYIPEPRYDFAWASAAFGFLFIYHFLPLQILAYASQVNLNNMLCPAVSDPFHGKYYRLFAMGHQVILIPLLGKLFVILSKAFNILPSNNPCEMPIGCVITEDCSRDCGMGDYEETDCDSGYACSNTQGSKSLSRGRRTSSSRCSSLCRQRSTSCPKDCLNHRSSSCTLSASRRISSCENNSCLEQYHQDKADHLYNNGVSQRDANDSVDCIDTSLVNDDMFNVSGQSLLDNSLQEKSHKSRLRKRTPDKPAVVRRINNGNVMKS